MVSCRKHALDVVDTNMNEIQRDTSSNVCVQCIIKHHASEKATQTLQVQKV